MHAIYFRRLLKPPKPSWMAQKTTNSNQTRHACMLHMRTSGQSRDSWPTKNMSTNRATRKDSRTNYIKRLDLRPRHNISIVHTVEANKENDPYYHTTNGPNLCMPTLPWISLRKDIARARTVNNGIILLIHGATKVQPREQYNTCKQNVYSLNVPR
jgi:hypothetical protein